MKKALVVIDLQKGFITKLTRALPWRIRNYINEFAKDYGLIIFTQYKNHSDSNFVKNLDYNDFMKKEETDIANELKELTNDKNVFMKDTYGSFVDDKVLNVLKRHKIQEVDLTGIDTENCVLTFARDAFDRGFKVSVLKNLCASHSNPALHRAALKIISDNIGKVK